MEVASKGENTNYSFDLFIEDIPKNEFYSLIVSKTEEGVLEEPYIIGYTMTEEDYETYLAHDMDFRYFRATQRFYSFDSFFADTQKGMTGRNGDCGSNIIGGSGTGSNSGGNGGGSGGGPLTAPGETFTTNFSGGAVNSTFGVRQNTNMYVYEQTINTPTGSTTTTTTANSASISTVATTSAGVYNYPPVALAGEYWLNFTIEIIIAPSGGSSADCWKIIGLRDGSFTVRNDCPPNVQLKKGTTNKSISTSLSNCFIVSGGVGINVTTVAVEINKMLGDIELSDDELAYLTEHKDEALPIFKFLRVNSVERSAFAYEAFKALRKGSEVDFIEQIINDLTGKADCVFRQLKLSNLNFGNKIKKFDGEFPVSHLKFTEDKNIKSNTLKAYTIPPKNYIIEIVLNGNNLSDASHVNRPKLMIAKTIIHEIIHAEMFRKLISLGNNNGSIDSNKAMNMLNKGDYPGMLDYYLRSGAAMNSEWQHEQMAAHYRETIGRALQEFDTGIFVADNIIPNQLYLDLAWEGLIYSDIKAWNDVYSDNERERIKNVISNYINSNKEDICVD